MYEYATSYTRTHVAAQNGNTRKKKTGSIREGAKRKVKEREKMALSGQEIKGIRPIVYEQGEQYGEAEQAQPFLNHHGALPAVVPVRALVVGPRRTAGRSGSAIDARRGNASAAPALHTRGHGTRQRRYFAGRLCPVGHAPVQGTVAHAAVPVAGASASATRAHGRWSGRTLPASRLAAIGLGQRAGPPLVVFVSSWTSVVHCM